MLYIDTEQESRFLQLLIENGVRYQLVFYIRLNIIAKYFFTFYDIFSMLNQTLFFMIREIFILFSAILSLFFFFRKILIPFTSFSLIFLLIISCRQLAGHFMYEKKKSNNFLRIASTNQVIYTSVNSVSEFLNAFQVFGLN